MCVASLEVRLSAKMSILKYFHPLTKKNDLPDPSGPLSEQMPSMAITSANVKILEALKEEEEKKKRSRKPYFLLTPTKKYEIGKRVSEHGVTASIRYYNMSYG